MAPVTEFALLQAKPDSDLAPLEASKKTLLEQPGCLGFRFSRLHEDKDKVRLFIDWESLGAHQEFAGKDTYKPFLDALDVMLTSTPIVYHVSLSPSPPTVLDNEEGRGTSAVTEIVQIYFPGGDGFTADLMADTAKNTQAFFDALRGVAPKGFSGETAGGWALEELEFKGEKCRLFAVVIGWDSVESHVKFRGTEDFAKIVPLLRGLEGLKGMEMCHVSNKTAKPIR